ncbi:MAG: DegV family EDD domain-containing protein [Lachnospiraceae bacterium]|nr:DegV family EDD domain-containing protein [Lachnospiraceae bacterium]
MRILRRLNERVNSYLFDSSIYIKDRTFVLFTSLELMALLLNAVVAVILGDPLTSALASLMGVAVGVVILIILVRMDKIKVAKISTALVLVLFLRPAAFFTKGGVDNGTMVMMLLGSYYLIMVLDGVFRIVICLIDTSLLVTCGVIAYHHPEYLTAYYRKSNYTNSFVQYIIGLVVLTILISFWTRILQKETRLAEEKTKELEELNRSQSRFFSSMSHEIRTPINTVLGLNEIILRQEDASEEIKKDARNIQGAGRLLLALINDILDVSKIEAGKMDIVPVDYNVSSLLSEIVNMIWLKAEEKGLKFEVDIDPGVPEVLFGDEVRIKQILINLLNNAVKYTKEGSVSLHMECETGDGRDALLKINVSDTGMGVKPDALPHLFDTFQRVDEEKNRYIEGTGLGLSIVKQLVELMEGEITVNSVYGQGSIFSVTLKQGISSDNRIGDISISGIGSRAGQEKFQHSFHAPDARILIVDDNEMNLQVEEKLLDGTEMVVDLAMSGAEALKKTLQFRYDVIFMDHLMPEMDGIDCFEHIRSQKGGLNQNTPVVVLTANAGGENIELYNNTGFDGYLVKPVSGRQLEDMLMVHLSAEKVITIAGSEMTGSRLNTASGYTKKKPVIIATSTMSDLPQNIVKELQISIIPYTVITNEGVFYDNIDIDSEELVRYMADKTKMVDSEPPTEEALTAFFAGELMKAHHLIYITLTTGSSREYGRAVRAAESFENVTIVNSEMLSSATGILVMIAARLAQQGLPVEKIVSELEETKQYIRCSFVIKSTDIMARRDRISPMMNSLLNALWLRPFLRMNKDKLGVGGLLFGSDRNCYGKYMDHALPATVSPDTSFIFITYAGMSEEELMWVEKKVRERVDFDNIIFQKASAGISSNCGEGTFGLLYLVKGNRNYNFESLFAKLKEQEKFDEYDEEETENTDDTESLTSDETPGEAADESISETKWYEEIPGIDPEAAVKNSGSEEAFLSVLKIYYDSYEVKSGEIQKFFDSEDWENYTIKVHALKSSSRLVGAIQLGNDAEAMEMAGKERDTGYITAHHEALMNEYRTIIDALTPELGVADDRPDIPADMLKDAYAGLAEFAEAMDYELAKMVTDSVKEYRLPEDDSERFVRLGECMSRLDWDGIKEILKEV